MFRYLILAVMAIFMIGMIVGQLFHAFTIFQKTKYIDKQPMSFSCVYGNKGSRSVYLNTSDQIIELSSGYEFCDVLDKYKDYKIEKLSVTEFPFFYSDRIKTVTFKKNVENDSEYEVFVYQADQELERQNARVVGSVLLAILIFFILYIRHDMLAAKFKEEFKGFK